MPLRRQALDIAVGQELMMSHVRQDVRAHRILRTRVMPNRKPFAPCFSVARVIYRTPERQRSRGIRIVVYGRPDADEAVANRSPQAIPCG
jgi:hypothetical protein